MNAGIHALDELLEQDQRFKLDAYRFVRESLQYAHDELQLSNASSSQPQDEATGSRHLTGQQLCEACRLYAVLQYGYLAKLVLGSWGITCTGDIGEVVYNLIRIEQMRKSDSDQREDFDDVYDFEDAFQPEFEALSSDLA